MPARFRLLTRGPLALALIAVVGAAAFIAGDLLGLRMLRPIGGGLALASYAGLLMSHRPARPWTERDAEPGGQRARHVA